MQNNTQAAYEGVIAASSSNEGHDSSPGLSALTVAGWLLSFATAQHKHRYPFISPAPFAFICLFIIITCEFSVQWL